MTVIRLAPLLALALAVALSGCAGEGVELNGKIFDAMGLSGSSAKQDPVIARRNGIVLPPKSAALPVPGSGSDVALSVEQQLPNDPKLLMAQKAASEKAAEEKRCRDQANRPKVEDTGPSCNSLLKALTGKNLTETIADSTE